MVERARGRSGVRLVAVLVLISFNLRATIAAVPPLLTAIRHDLGLSGAAAGVLTALPVISMGLFAPPAQALAHRIGREATIGWALVLLTAGAAVRLLGAHLLALYGGTLLAGMGIAVAQTVLSGFVKEHFASRAGLVTGLYSMSMSAGATAASALAVPLQGGVGSWQGSLALWALPAAVAAATWWPATRRYRRAHRIRRADSPPVTANGLPWRSRTAWLISGYLALQSWIFYSMLSWLPPMLIQDGWSPAHAGYLLSGFNLVGLGGALVLPTLATRHRDRRPWFFVAVGASAVALPVLSLDPTFLPGLWVLLLGFGAGSGFPLGLLLLVDHAPDAAASARLSAMAFLIAYSVAAVGPVALGVLRDATGDYTAAFGLVAVAALLELGFAAAFSPRRRERGIAALGRPQLHP